MEKELDKVPGRLVVTYSDTRNGCWVFLRIAQMPQHPETSNSGWCLEREARQPSLRQSSARTTMQRGLTWAVGLLSGGPLSGTSGPLHRSRPYIMTDIVHPGINAAGSADGNSTNGARGVRVFRQTIYFLHVGFSNRGYICMSTKGQGDLH